MKLRLLLAASLAANLALVVVLLRRGGEASSSPVLPAGAPAAGAKETSAPVSAVAAEAGSKPAARAVPEPNSTAALRWAGDAMRREEYPEGAIQVVLASLAQAQIRDRLRAPGISPYSDPAEFWRGQGAVNLTPEQAAARREIEKEITESLNAFIADGSEDEKRRVGFGLPAETTAQLLRINANYRQRSEDAQLLPRAEVPGKLAELQKERRGAIEGLLTPEQLYEFDLRMGAGNGLHNRLGAFAATEAEFRALYAAQKALFEGNSAGMSLAPAAQAQFEPELRRVLGEARYAEVLAANEARDNHSRGFVEMRTFLDGLKLPPATASEVVTLQNLYQPQLSALPENASTRRAEIGLAARRDLLRALGPDGFEAYERSKGGWLPPAP